jgi:DNA-binding transcriptional MerR regulator
MDAAPFTIDTKHCTVGYVARTLGVSESRVRQLSDAGRLPCMRIGGGGLRIFLVEDVERLRTIRATGALGR